MSKKVYEYSIISKTSDISKYEAALEAEQMLTVQFTSILPDGTLVYSEKGFDYEARMVPEEYLPANASLDDQKAFSRERAKHLYVPHTVLITSIDHDKHIIYVSDMKSGTVLKRSLCTDAVQGIFLNKPIEVDARVIAVHYAHGQASIEISLCDLGVIGYIPASEWSASYTSVYSIPYRVKKNDVVRVSVFGISTPRPVYTMTKRLNDGTDALTREEAAAAFSADAYDLNAYRFVCSRAKAMGDPYIGIEERFPKGTIVDVVVTDKKESFFYCLISTYPDITVRAYYPDAKETAERFAVKQGEVYQAIISECSESRKFVIAKPFRKIADKFAAKKIEFGAVDD